jgi:hypothetical protein
MGTVAVFLLMVATLWLFDRLRRSLLGILGSLLIGAAWILRILSWALRWVERPLAARNRLQGRRE